MTIGGTLFWVIYLENQEQSQPVEATLLCGNLNLKIKDVRKILRIKNDMEFCGRNFKKRYEKNSM